ncbi:putative formin, FH2 domain superfamily [Helianthus annuus]|nr:putative formin, FH2 domain superfamily [Helianthus annuus]
MHKQSNTLNKFISHAEVEVTSVTNFFTIVGKSADGLALYFGEDPARCPFEQGNLHILFRVTS